MMTETLSPSVYSQELRDELYKEAAHSIGSA